MTFTILRTTLLCLASAAALWPATAQAQGNEARVQVVHNAPDPDLAVVDVAFDLILAPPDGASRGGLAPQGGAAARGGDPALAFDDVAFREATPYTGLTAGPYQIRVTLPDDPDAIVIDSLVTVDIGDTLQVVVIGVTLDGAAGGAEPTARLILKDDAIEEGTDELLLSANAVHGTPDAPTIDLRRAQSTSVLFDDLEYGESTDYIEIQPVDGFIEVVPAEGGEPVATFRGDFRGEDGNVLTLLASGFLTPEDEVEGAPAFGLLAVRPDGETFLLPRVLDIFEARQLPLGTTVEVEGIVTRALGDFTRMQDDTGGITIRQTSGEFNEDVADGTINTGTLLRVTGETSEFRGLFQINGDDLTDYQIIDTVLPPQPQAVTLSDIADDGEQYESELIEVINLTTNATDETFAAATTYGVSDETLGFGTVSLRIPNADDTEIDGEPIPDDLFTFTGVLSQFTFSDPADDGYQLFPVYEEDIEEQDTELAQIQVIHNAPDPALDEVDVYIDGERILDDVPFRNASSFLDVAASAPVEVVVTRGADEDTSDPLFSVTRTFDPDVLYQLIAVGVEEPDDFEANPEGIDTDFTVLVNEGARDTGENGEEFVDVNFVHGTPDASAIDVFTLADDDTRGDPDPTFEDLSYTDIAPYQPVEPALTEVVVTNAGGSTVADPIATFQAGLASFGGEALTLLLSGFRSTDDEPEGAPGLALLAVFSDGTTQIYLPAPVSNEGGPVPAAFAVEDNYPNPFARTTTLRYDLPADAEVRLEVYDTLGREVLRVPAGAVAAGAARTLWLDAAGLAAGTYLWRLTAEAGAETFTETGRLTLVR